MFPTLMGADGSCIDATYCVRLLLEDRRVFLGGVEPIAA